MHDGPISANQAGTMVFFSNNSYSKKNKLGIFYSSKEGDAWTLPLAFPLNNEGYNVTHPFYDEANKKLYYASDFEKGNSKYDLYYSDYNGKDWSRPIAIQAINSDSIECFPFVYKNKIYFTSNNKLSMGGLDLFDYENDTEYKGWKSLYEVNKDVAAMSPKHKEYENYYMSQQNMKAEGGIMDLGGMEKDYRAEGGFVPIGREEKADDVPARLSVNEFVFTADAVRNAGGGDIDQGAQVMENMMKNLENGGRVSEESQGNTGAQDMFSVSERIGEVI